MRLPVLVAVAAVAGLAAPASGLPGDACGLVKDARGDAAHGGFPGNDGDDVLSADLGSDGRSVAAVVRPAVVPVRDPQAPMGRAYWVRFRAPGSEATLFLVGRTHPTRFEFAYGVESRGTRRTLGLGTGVADEQNGTVRVVAPVDGWRGEGVQLRRGARLTGIAVTTARIGDPGSLPTRDAGLPELGFDEATTSAAAVVGKGSCVYLRV